MQWYDVAKALTANAFKREFTVTYNYNGNGTANTTAKATATFNGWAKTSSGSVAYTNKQSVKNLSSTQGAVVDIYAKWTDGSVTLPTPTRTGYKFSGWYTATSGGTKVGGGGDSYKPTKNITLYARWTPITYTVKYYLDGTEQTEKNRPVLMAQAISMLLFQALRVIALPVGGVAVLLQVREHSAPQAVRSLTSPLQMVEQ